MLGREEPQYVPSMSAGIGGLRFPHDEKIPTLPDGFMSVFRQRAEIFMHARVTAGRRQGLVSSRNTPQGGMVDQW